MRGMILQGGSVMKRGGWGNECMSVLDLFQ